jgi:hypothetical protein
MKSSSITLIGQFDKNGKFLLSNKHELDSFGKKWKNKKLILTGTVFAENGSPLLRGYYFNKIVPDIRNILKENGELYSFKKVDEMLRDQIETMKVEVPKEESGGFDLVRIKTVYELNNVELVEFIDSVRRFISEIYGVSIPDPSK